MYRKSIILLYSIIIFGGALLLFVRTAHTRASRRKSKGSLTIVCTTNIIADAVKEIAGDKCTVYALMGPGIDPHLYRARESDVHKLAHADIIFYNGLHLEGKMTEILSAINRYTKSIAVSDALSEEDLIAKDQFKTAYDPHIWLDVQLWTTCVKFIAHTIMNHDKKHATYYNNRLQTYVKKLTILDLFVKKSIMTIPLNQRVLVTAHDAFGYFGKAYALSVVGLQGISTESEAGTRDVQKLALFISTHKIPALFAESSVPERNIEAVRDAAQARGWRVVLGPKLFSDSLGDSTTEATTYEAMIRYNTTAIVSSLTKSSI